MTRSETEALSELWSVEELKGGLEAGPTRRFLILPSPDKPRLVLPTRPHRAAGAILKALRDKSSMGARGRSLAVRAALATNTGGTQLPDPGLVEVAKEHLPDRDYAYGVHLGPPRANRKPVLALATPDGDLVAFVKLGVGSLTDRLVRAESVALGAVSHLETVHVPRLIAAGDYRSHPYVIQSPVPTDRPSRTNLAAVIAAQVEVASVGQSSINEEAAIAATVDQWRRRAHDAAAIDRGVAAFAHLAERWAEQVRQMPVVWGSWHGDWRPTNMAVTASGCSVWDWERFATGVPVGYDALHLFLVSHASSCRNLTSLPADLFDNAQRLLRPFGVSTREVAEVTATGYLLELAGRYLDDDQAGSGARLGSVREWLLPYLTTLLAQQGPVTRGEE